MYSNIGVRYKVPIIGGRADAVVLPKWSIYPDLASIFNAVPSCREIIAYYDSTPLVGGPVSMIIYTGSPSGNLRFDNGLIPVIDITTDIDSYFLVMGSYEHSPSPVRLFTSGTGKFDPVRPTMLALPMITAYKTALDLFYDIPRCRSIEQVLNNTSYLCDGTTGTDFTLDKRYGIVVAVNVLDTEDFIWWTPKVY